MAESPILGLLTIINSLTFVHSVKYWGKGMSRGFKKVLKHCLPQKREILCVPSHWMLVVYSLLLHKLFKIDFISFED
jgi:hypothetical protein